MFKFLYLLFVVITLVQSGPVGNHEFKTINKPPVIIDYQPIFPESNVRIDHIQILKVFDSSFASNKTSDPDTFILVKNELHWLAERSLVKIAIFRDPSPFDGTIISIVEIQACQWDNKIIFVVDAGNIYYVYMLKMSYDVKQQRLSVLRPIQSIVKHGKGQSISFITLENGIYCMLAANYPEETRSELRMLKWKKSFFQTAQTIVNRNHQIDRVVVEFTENLIILIDNKQQEHDTLIHVYTYSDSTEDEDDILLDIKRIQVISTAHDLQADNIFLYNSYTDRQLYMAICGANLLQAHRCEYYVWKNDGIDDTILFQRIEQWQLIDSISLNQLQSDAPRPNQNQISSNVYTEHELLTLQFDKYIIVVDDKTNHDGDQTNRNIVVECETHNLKDVFVVKKRSSSHKNRFRIKLMCLYVCMNSLECQGITFKLIGHNLFDEYVHEDPSKSSVREKNVGTRSNKEERLRRIRDILLDLKGHLISQREEYLKPIHKKANSLKTILKVIRLLHDGAPINGVIFANKTKLVPNTGNTVKKVILRNQSTSQKNISTLRSELETINENIKSVLNENSQKSKRSLVSQDKWTGETLHVHRLYLKTDNHVFNDAVNRPNGEQDKPLYLHGKVRAKHLTVKKITQFNTTSSGTDAPILQQNQLQRRKIFVKSINGVNWNEFVKTVYRRGKNTVINGYLVLKNTSAIKSLVAEDINDLPTSEFLTFSTDQTIASSVFIPRMLATDVQTNIFNDMKHFAENVVVIGRTNFIQSPVKMAVFNVTESLLLSDGEGDEMTHHIVGTRLEDLTQIYNGRIVIKGSLTMNNVLISSTGNNLPPPIREEPVNYENNPEKGLIIVNNKRFDLAKVAQEFWLKSVDQKFGSIFFTVPIYMPQITADFVNSHPADEFFVLDDKPATPGALHPLKLVFKGDVEVRGNLDTNAEIANTLVKLNSEAVKLNAGRVTITSPITFKDRLIVDHAIALIDTDSFVRRSKGVRLTQNQTENFNAFGRTACKHFKQNLIVENDVVILGENLTNIEIIDFNEHTAIPDKFKSIIALNDQPLVITGAVIFNDEFGANEINIAKFIDNSYRSSIQYDKDYDLNRIFSNIFQFRENRIRTLTINGSVHFAHSKDAVEIKTLNGLDLSNYLSIVVTSDGANSNQKFVEIGGEKTFEADLNAQFATVSVFNRNIYADDWIKNALRKRNSGNKAQTIGGFYWRIENLVADNIEINKLNDVQFKATKDKASDIIFVDNDRNHVININSDLSFTNGIRINSIAELNSTDTRPCNIRRLFEETVGLTQNRFKYLSIGGNVAVNNVDGVPARDTLSNFFENAVLYNTNQDIHANIVFSSASNEMFVLSRINVVGTDSETINNVNLVKLYEDAVTKSVVSVDGKTQPVIIYGRKDFIGETTFFDGSAVVSSANFLVQSINGVNVKELDESIISKNTNEIRIDAGQKLLFLQSPIIEAMSIDPNETISGVRVDDIFFIYSPRPNQLSPMIWFDSIPNAYATNKIHTKEKLEVDLLNGMSLRYFIANRVKLSDESGLTSFNRPQEINGYFTFENLIIYGNDSKVNQMNNVACDDIVLTKSSTKQIITGNKQLSAESSLYLNKPSHTWSINDVEIAPAFSSTIFLNQNQSLNQLTIEAPYQMETKGGLIVRGQLNGIRVGGMSGEVPQVSAVHSVPSKVHNEKTPKVVKLNYIDTTDDFHIEFDPTVEVDLRNLTAVKSTWFTIDSLHREEVIERTNESAIHEHSLCPVQYRFEHMKSSSKHILIQRASTVSRLLTISIAPNYVFHIQTEFVTAEHYFDKCKFVQENRQMGDKPKSIVFLNYQKILSLPEIVESSHFFHTEAKSYLVLHLHNTGIYTYRQNELGGWSNVTSLPIHPSERPTIFNVKLLKWKSFIILVVARSHTLVQSTSSTNTNSYTTLYLFDGKTETYTEFKQMDGDYNIISGVGVVNAQRHEINSTISNEAGDFYLLLAMQSKPYMKFFKAIISEEKSEASIRFELILDQAFDTPVESISVFSEHGISYVAVMLSSSHFHIYQHLPRQTKQTASWIDVSTNTWHENMSGHFKYGKAMQAITINDKIYLFILSDFSNSLIDTTNQPPTQIAKIFTLYYY